MVEMVEMVELGSIGERIFMVGPLQGGHDGRVWDFMVLVSCVF